MAGRPRQLRSADATLLREPGPVDAGHSRAALPALQACPPLRAESADGVVST